MITAENETIRTLTNLLATRLRKLADNLGDEAATDDLEGCTILENVTGIRELANEFIEWYDSED